MAKVELLDCTLRDGGHVIDWKFGQERIRKIIQNLSDAKLDYVEIGFLRDIDYDPDRSLFSKVEQANDLLESLENDTNISLMVRPDWIDLKKLPQAAQVNSIRFAFYERDLQLVLKQAKIAAGAGYKVFVNPINILSYTPKSLESLLIKINAKEIIHFFISSFYLIIVFLVLYLSYNLKHCYKYCLNYNIEHYYLVVLNQNQYCGHLS